MKSSTLKPTSDTLIERSPVIAIMGHIDHGKSTLLDFIRKTNIAEKEAGGITQHIGAYEIRHTLKNKKERRITFLDTPGHAAFTGIRNRGANAADVAVLVVSAEEGVKPQTIEALGSIHAAKIPYLVAITKMDSPKADLERIKQSLAENEIYLEGYGGEIPWAAVSAKTGANIPELLDLMLLVSDLAELRGNPAVPAEGVVIETNLDKRKGISATLIIKNGTLANGMTVLSGKSIAPVRVMENYLGERLTEATFSSPIKIVGFDTLPRIGDRFYSFSSKKDAEAAQMKVTDAKPAHILPTSQSAASDVERVIIPLIIKADVAGTLEAIESELRKIHQPNVGLLIVQSGVGDVSESDIKSAAGNKDIRVIAFNCRIDSQAKAFAERLAIEVNSFDIIYKLVEWVEALAKSNVPKVEVEEITGKAKILKVFSKNKDKQVVGGRVLEGTILIGEDVKITRRETEIGRGKIRELQQQKQKVSEAKRDTEFGTMIESKIEIAAGDQIQAIQIVTR